jgi:methylenetetrahydrofolate reductase (NADPH)
MPLSTAYGPNRFGLSFELFPPKTDAGEGELFRHLDDLMAFEPSYVTCTYGAGGSTRAKTLDIVERVRSRFGCPVASHLTCVGSSADQLRDYLNEAWRRGVENIVALRGDPPKGETCFQAVAGGLSYANELVSLVRGEFPQFGVAVAGYPETHREAPSPDADLANLKRKVDAGADVVITQLFYDNADFFRFRQRCQRAGIGVPIVPGILPVTNFAQVKKFAALCGAEVPDWIAAQFDGLDEDPETRRLVAASIAAEQCRLLQANGVNEFHFYTLNRADLTVAICHMLGVRGRAPVGTERRAAG